MTLFLRSIGALVALSVLSLAPSAWAEIKWDSGFTGFSVDATGHIATRLGSSWNGITVDTAVTGLHCVEERVTAKSSSFINGAANNAAYKPGTGSWLGNTADSVGMQDGGAVWLGGPNVYSDAYSIGTGYTYICENTVAQRIWFSRDLVTFYGNSTTGNGITAATVASTTSTGIDVSGLTPHPPTYFAAACDAACTVVFNGGYKPFNSVVALPSGYTTAEPLAATATWFQIWSDQP